MNLFRSSGSLHPKNVACLRWLLFSIIFGIWLSQSACKKASPPAAAAKNPVVFYSTPVVQEVVDYEDFIGQTKSPYSIDIRARVSGYLIKTDFVDGNDVEQGQPLFEIDARPYEADLENAKATVSRDEALVRKTSQDLVRAKRLQPTGSISVEELTQKQGDADQAKASLDIAKANLKKAELNFKFCKVEAPISGRISRRMIDPGNLVKADDTILTSIVSLNPMYAYFDIDERTLLKLRRMVQDKSIKSRKEAKIKVDIGLADEDRFSLVGYINFSENKIDSNTGTLNLRAEIDNKTGFLSPGLFVRTRLYVGNPQERILVPERALGSDQGQRFIYYINDKDQVEYRTVKIGQLHGDLRVVESGLNKGDRFIVVGLQRVRKDATVTPKLYVPTEEEKKTARKGEYLPSQKGAAKSADKADPQSGNTSSDPNLKDVGKSTNPMKKVGDLPPMNPPVPQPKVGEVDKAFPKGKVNLITPSNKEELGTPMIEQSPPPRKTEENSGFKF